MVLKLLGLGKKSEYFLEAPPANNGAEPAKAAEPTPAPVKEEPPKAVAEAPAQPEVVANAVEKPAEAAPKTKKMKATKSASPEAKPAPAPAAVKPAAKPAAPEVKNFATDGLMPLSAPRRRPGPSLNPFKDMAKDVTPRK